MASISTGGDGHGGKKEVDADIPLIPFIDLLLCCVMFLLVTAVWNQLGSVEANLPQSGRTGDPATEVEQRLPLTVLIDHEGYRVGSDAGDETRIPLAAEGEWDVSALRAHLEHRRDIAPNEHDVVVSADDGVQYARMVETMDVLAGSGYSGVTVSGGL